MIVKKVTSSKAIQLGDGLNPSIVIHLELIPKGS